MLFIKQLINVKKFLFAIFLLSTTNNAQIAIGAEEVSLANSSVAKFGSALSVFTNPASLSNTTLLQIGCYYSPSPFGLNELSTISFAVTNPFSFGILSAGISSFGFNLFRENIFLLSGARQVEDNLFVGTTVRVNQISIANYGSDFSFCFDVGMIYELNEQLNLGIAMQNINRASYGDEDDQIGSNINFGFHFQPIETGSINLSILKETRYEESLQLGAAYNIFNYLEIRSGFSSNPKLFSAGVGVKYLFFNFDFASTFHRELGFSHQLSILFYPSKF